MRPTIGILLLAPGQLTLREADPATTENINSVLKDMGFENTTGEVPSNDSKQFLRKMKHAYPTLRDITFISLMRDDTTNEIFMLTKIDDLKSRRTVRDLMMSQRRKRIKTK